MKNQKLLIDLIQTIGKQKPLLFFIFSFFVAAVFTMLFLQHQRKMNQRNFKESEPSNSGNKKLTVNKKE